MDLLILEYFKIFLSLFESTTKMYIYWVFANGTEDQGSILGRIIPKTQKIVLDVALLNTQNYEGGIKGKVEQSREWRSALPYTSVL